MLIVGNVGIAITSICSICAVVLAVPAHAAPPRPYEGPREADPVTEPTAEPRVTPDDAMTSEAEDEASADDDEPVDDEAVPLTEWRETPEGEAAVKRIRGGIILSVGGLALVFGSAILGGTDPCRRLAGNGCQKEARTRAALTMGIPGGFILAAGATLLGVGLAQRRKLRSSLSVGAAASRQGGGFVLSGRF